jgi:hypothetical protein
VLVYAASPEAPRRACESLLHPRLRAGGLFHELTLPNPWAHAGTTLADLGARLPAGCSSWRCAAAPNASCPVGRRPSDLGTS